MVRSKMSQRVQNYRAIQPPVNRLNASLQSGKDLVQEVAKLRRSLDDAEGLSRDTKKEWAVLRSQKISLEETMVGPGNTFTSDALFHSVCSHSCPSVLSRSP